MATEIANKFRVEAEIGSDTTASFYRCSTIEPSAQVVIVKRLFPELFNSPGAVDRVRRSVLRFASPLHENVSRVLDFVRSADEAYYLVEDFPGNDIYDWCRATRPIDAVLPVLLQTAKGLAAIHDAGIIHRNLKSETIFVADDGRVKIAESVIAAGSTDANTIEGILGEIDNVPPEYLEHGDLTCRGDVYSLGLIAFELITGRSPFHGKSVIETMTMRVKAEAPSPREYAPTCPESVAEIVNKALRKDPNARFQAASELVRALEAVIR